MDITLVPTLHDGMQKVAFVKDNYSGALLHCRSTDRKAGGEFIRDLFQETFKMYNLYDCKINIGLFQLWNTFVANSRGNCRAQEDSIDTELLLFLLLLLLHGFFHARLKLRFLYWFFSSKRNLST